MYWLSLQHIQQKLEGERASEQKGDTKPENQGSQHMKLLATLAVIDVIGLSVWLESSAIITSACDI